MAGEAALDHVLGGLRIVSSASLEVCLERDRVGTWGKRRGNAVQFHIFVEGFTSIPQTILTRRDHGASRQSDEIHLKAEASRFQ